MNRSKSTDNLNDKEKDKNNDKKDKNLTLFDMQKTKRKVKSIPFDYDYQRKHTFKPEHTVVRGKSNDLKLRCWDGMKCEMERNSTQ